MDEKQKQIEEIMDVARRYIDDLLVKRKTGDYSVTILLSVNSGGIRNAYFQPQAKEKIL